VQNLGLGQKDGESWLEGKVKELERKYNIAKEVWDNQQPNVFQTLDQKVEESRETSGLRELQEEYNERVKTSSMLASSDRAVRTEQGAQREDAEANLTKARHRESKDCYLMNFDYTS
jgi:hypothetical protein